nr:MAG TPA: hypothetical protein [Caudoviricetes sp.]
MPPELQAPEGGRLAKRKTKPTTSGYRRSHCDTTVPTKYILELKAL